jgi:hypothetical protein
MDVRAFRERELALRPYLKPLVQRLDELRNDLGIRVEIWGLVPPDVLRVVFRRLSDRQVFKIDVVPPGEGSAMSESEVDAYVREVRRTVETAEPLQVVEYRGCILRMQSDDSNALFKGYPFQAIAERIEIDDVDAVLLAGFPICSIAPRISWEETVRELKAKVDEYWLQVEEYLTANGLKGTKVIPK